MQVLGDILENISSAIWKKLKPILSLIVTPKNMELQPLRKLQELFSYHHYEFNVSTTKTRNVHVAIVQIQVKESIISGEGSNVKKWSAETNAAKHAFAQLKVFTNFSVLLFLSNGLARSLSA